MLNASLSSCNETNLPNKPSTTPLITDISAPLELNPLKRNAPADIATRRNNADQKCRRSDLGTLEEPLSFHCPSVEPNFGNWNDRRSPGHATAVEPEQISNSSLEFLTESSKKKIVTTNIQHGRSVNSSKDQACEIGTICCNQKHQSLDRISLFYDPDDNLAVFGQHVANEIRALKSPYQQSLAKLRIQQILFSISTDNDQAISEK